MKRYGLIGYPLGHSFSAGYFARKFKAEGIDAEYLNYEIPTAELLPDVVRENPTLAGLNVTIPHKQAVIPLLDSLSDEARAIGAVNVIRIDRRDGKTFLRGFNADVIGFTRSIRPLLRPTHRAALVLGTGGASKAVVHGLHQLGLTTQYVSRTPHGDTIGYDDLTPEVMATHTVVVNCTPAGMFPHVEACPDLPYGLATPDHLFYDLIYNPEETLFLRRAAEQGSTVKNGLEMLHLQAEASWAFWNSND